MIITLTPDHTLEHRKALSLEAQKLGLSPHIIVGKESTVIALVGLLNGNKEDVLHHLQTFEGVETIKPISKSYKLASRQVKKESTVVKVGKVEIGGGNLALIAGPCSVESQQQISTIAAAVKKAGAHILRGGAFKPRTTPYSFQGLGEDGLKMLRDAGGENGMPVVTEVMDTRQVPLVDRYADMFQIGARNMQNFDLLKEVGKTKKPVLIKRGMSSTVENLLNSAEYVLSEGNPNIVLCERGVISFDSSTRNMMDLAAIPNVKHLSHLPIIADPSHATGKPHLIPPMALASIAAGADGVHIEVHHNPKEALSDGDQALLPDKYAETVNQMRIMAGAAGKRID